MVSSELAAGFILEDAPAAPFSQEPCYHLHDVVLTFSGFQLDTVERRLFLASKEILLPPKTFDLLLLLASNSGKILSRESIYQVLWPDVFVDDHALSVQIAELRKALGDSPKNPTLIETRPRRGYRFLPAVNAAEQKDAIPAREVDSFVEPPTQYAQSGDYNIAYQVLGDGPIDLVFVMGWVSHLEYFWREKHFRRFLQRLAGFSRLILFDKRGTGLSDRVPPRLLPTLEQRMDDVRAVMDAVGSKRAAILGVSEGGPMSALFAATYPEKTLGLAMIGSYARRLRDVDYPWGPTAEEREAYLQQIRESWGGPIGIEERAPSLAQDPEFRQWWATYLRMGVSPGGAEALTRMNASIDVRAILPSVRVPTLVLHRKDDRTLLAEEGRYMASLIPNARYEEVPGADHLPFVGDQDDLLQPVSSFLLALRQAEPPPTTLATVLALRFRGKHQRLATVLEREIQWQRGLPVPNTANLFSFDGPARAVRCAQHLIEQCGGLEVEAHAVLHTGECELSEGVPSGGPAVETAKEMLQASKAPVEASRVLRDLVAGSGIEFSANPIRHLHLGGEKLLVYKVL
jgi:pimeloyl-ACP methyl ester carboxylesterase/DNA-binding winged helix-turn-helix (wHTH) protein